MCTPSYTNNTHRVNTMTMGQHLLALLGALAVDKRRKECLLTISIAFLLLDCQVITLN